MVVVVLAAAIGAPVGTVTTALATGWLISDDGSENSATSTEEWPKISDDSFTTTGAKRWTDDADTEETGGEYITDDAGDAYQISAERAMDRWGVLAWPPRLEAENVHMTVKAHRVGGSATDGYGYGLFCRADGQENLYAFTIWANHATIEKRIHGQASKKLGTDDRVTAAPEGDSEKELQAVCRTISGGAVELEFWVDNELILDPTDVDDPYTGGNFGLFAALGQGQGSIGDTLVVRFDDFLARGTASTPSR